MPRLRPQFELLVRESTKLECPKCASDELNKQMSVFAVSAPRAAARRHGRSARLWVVRRPAWRRQLLELREMARLSFAWRATALAARVRRRCSKRYSGRWPDVLRSSSATDHNAGGAEFGAAAVVRLERGVLASWVERADDLATLKFAERTAAGWTAARTVASGRNWFVNWADVPSVFDCRQVPSSRTGCRKAGIDVRVRRAPLVFKGRRQDVVAVVSPHHDGTPTEHGFASLFPMGDGFGLVWLDGRAMFTAPKPGEGGKPARRSRWPEGAMSVRFARFDRPSSKSRKAVVERKVCECCPTRRPSRQKASSRRFAIGATRRFATTTWRDW